MILFLRRVACRVRRHDLTEAWTDLRVDTYCQRCGRLVGRRTRLDVQLERFHVAIGDMGRTLAESLTPALARFNAALAAWGKVVARSIDDEISRLKR